MCCYKSRVLFESPPTMSKSYVKIKTKRAQLPRSRNITKKNFDKDWGAGRGVEGKCELTSGESSKTANVHGADSELN
jgi:hypothetical protein